MRHRGEVNKHSESYLRSQILFIGVKLSINLLILFNKLAGLSDLIDSNTFRIHYKCVSAVGNVAENIRRCWIWAD